MLDAKGCEHVVREMAKSDNCECSYSGVVDEPDYVLAYRMLCLWCYSKKLVAEEGPEFDDPGDSQ